MNSVEREQRDATDARVVARHAAIMDLHEGPAGSICERCTLLGVGHNMTKVYRPCGAYTTAATVIRDVGVRRARREARLQTVPAGPNVPATSRSIHERR